MELQSIFARSLLAGAMLALALPATAGWVDGPPLPDPRWLHAAAASKDGYVMVFGGRVLAGPNQRHTYGLGPTALVFFDPKTQTWEKASRLPPFNERVVNHIYERETAERDKANGIPDPPVHESPVEVHEFELPFGGIDGRGRAHYFVGLGSVYFDPHSRSWGQAESGVYHVYPPEPDPRLHSWIDGTRPSWTSRSLGTTATGPDGKLYLVGGMGYPLDFEKKISRTILNGLDIYDPESNKWRMGASMRIARQQLAAAFGGNGKLYVFGRLLLPRCDAPLPPGRQRRPRAVEGRGLRAGAPRRRDRGVRSQE